MSTTDDSSRAAVPRFLVMSTGRNAGLYARKLLASVASQTYENWRLVYVDDASDDDTPEVVRSVIGNFGVGARAQLIAQDGRKHKARNVYEALTSLAEPTDVVVMLDADDALAATTVLETLAYSYAQGWDVVWGNWVGSDGTPGTSSFLHPYLPVRAQPWVTSHLFSFRARLFDHVTPADLQDETGRWFEAACDVAVALPVLERTMRRRFIDQVLYIYNRTNPASHTATGPLVTNLSSARQSRAHHELTRRPHREPEPDEVFHRAHLYEFQCAAARAQLHMQRLREAALLGRLPVAPSAQS